jgi:hypothetical protein
MEKGFYVTFSLNTWQLVKKKTSFACAPTPGFHLLINVYILLPPFQNIYLYRKLN